MTPKQKAEELIGKYKSWDVSVFYDGDYLATNEMIYVDAVKCAIIAVEEIIKALPHEEQEHNSIVYNYWDEVINELKSMK
jgi:hypothetical protein